MTDERIRVLARKMWSALIYDHRSKGAFPSPLSPEEITDFARAIEREVREECAKVIDDHAEMTNLRTGERSLVPREKGNLSAIAYADAIRKGGAG